MTKKQPEEVLTLPTFGRRKMASRVCVVDGKPHVRKFLCETLEDIGFITCECAHVGALDAVLDEPLGVDLVVVGFANGVQAASVVDALAAKAFGGKVLLLGPRNSATRDPAPPRDAASDFFRDPDSIMNLCRQMPNHPAFDGLIVEIGADLSADLDVARAGARQVRFSNIAVSVDDLGSECLSLVGLDDFPFAEVKVDVSSLRAAPTIG